MSNVVSKEEVIAKLNDRLSEYKLIAVTSSQFIPQPKCGSNVFIHYQRKYITNGCEVPPTHNNKTYIEIYPDVNACYAIYRTYLHTKFPDLELVDISSWLLARFDHLQAWLTSPYIVQPSAGSLPKHMCNAMNEHLRVTQSREINKLGEATYNFLERFDVYLLQFIMDQVSYRQIREALLNPQPVDFDQACEAAGERTRKEEELREAKEQAERRLEAAKVEKKPWWNFW